MQEINQKIYDKAIQLLSVRLHTTGELFKKLKTRGFSPADIAPIIKQLEEQRFLDDQRFAEIFVDNLKRYKNWGYYGIKVKLLNRQIPADMAEAALAEYYTADEEAAVAVRYLQKITNQGKELPWEKLAGKLQSKGFRTEIIRQVLENL